MASENAGSSRSRRIRRPVPNMRSLPERVACLKLAFTDQQKTWVENMGFGSLIEMDNLKLDRYLTFWLMERFDDRNVMLKLRENVELEVKANDVAWILGIPNNIAPIRKIFKKDQAYLDLKARYETLSMDGDKARGIKDTAVLSCIRNDIDYDEFKVHFLVYVLGTFLCPNQGNHISSKMLRVALNVGDPLEYDWATFVLDELLEVRRKVREKRESLEDEQRGRQRNDVQVRQFPIDYARGMSGGYGGCLMILVIFYLDRLKRRKIVGWGSKHGFRVRLLAWIKETMEVAVQDDYDESTDEFGNANLLDDPDLRYGERHPDEAKGVLYKDIMFSDRRSTFRHKVDPRSLKHPRRLRSINQVQTPNDAEVGCSGSGNVCDEVGGDEEDDHGGDEEDDHGGDGLSGGVHNEEDDRADGDDGNFSPGDYGFAQQLEDMLNEGPINEVPFGVEPDHNHGNGEDNEDVLDGDGIVENRRPTKRSIRRTNRNARTRLDWRYIAYGGLCVSIKEEVMVDIHEVVYATRWDLRTLLKPNSWLSSSAECRSRYIFDLHYAIMAIEEDTGTFLQRCISTDVLKGCRKALAETGCTPAHCRHIFLPICYDNHWWAMCFDMEDEKIWELDTSLGDNGDIIRKMV